MGRVRYAVVIAGCLTAMQGSAAIEIPAASAAESAPSAYTGEASALTTSTVTLKGSTDPHNQQTSGYFQYGQSTTYGAQTPTTSIGTGWQTFHVAAPVTGLAANTTYHYRFVAVNATGATDGQDRVFTTKKIPLTFKLLAPKLTVFGSPFAVSGTLSGTGSANHAVVLEGSGFPFLSSFKVIGGIEFTDATGAFSFPVVNLSRTTQLRVATVEKSPVNSPALLERIAAKVTLHVLPTGRHGYVRMVGKVAPAQSLAVVYFQLLRPHRKPVSAGNAIIRGRSTGVSHFDSVVHIRHAGLYRAYVQVSSGAVVSNHSHPVFIG
jgi:hypothetical protein